MLYYDNNGNLTADGSDNTYVYDAWNRLVTVNNNSTTVAAYGYDGLGRRITETHDSTTTSLYLSAANQVLEEVVSDVAQARNVWSPVYVNALVLGDQSSQHNGVLDQRLYVQQDADWNVTTLVDTSGNVMEHYAYDSYGVQRVLNPDFSVRSTSNYNVSYGFQGTRRDLGGNLLEAWERVYNTALMRWLQSDPIGLNAGNNYYAFENDGPTDGVDPSGLDVIVLYTDDAAGGNGHLAVLIGPDKNGKWYYRSFHPKYKLPSSPGELIQITFSSLTAAWKSRELVTYSEYARFRSSQEADEKAVKMIDSEFKTDTVWDFGTRNCVHAVQSGMKGAGLPFEISTISYSRGSWRGGFYYGHDIGNNNGLLTTGFIISSGVSASLYSSWSIPLSYISDIFAVADPYKTIQANKDNASSSGWWSSLFDTDFGDDEGGGADF